MIDVCLIALTFLGLAVAPCLVGLYIRSSRDAVAETRGTIQTPHHAK